jgi:hypothetical protein
MGFQKQIRCAETYLLSTTNLVVLHQVFFAKKVPKKSTAWTPTPPIPFQPKDDQQQDLTTLPFLARLSNPSAAALAYTAEDVPQQPQLQVPATYTFSPHLMPLEPPDSALPTASNPFPTLSHLLTLTLSLQTFISTHHAPILDEQSSITERPLPLTTHALSTLLRFQPFQTKLLTLISSSLIPPFSPEVQTIDSTFKPLLGRLIELDKTLRALVHPPEYKCAKKRWQGFGRQTYWSWYSLVSQIATRVQKHSLELLNSDEFQR